MRARDRRPRAALALGLATGLGGCVIDARLGALDDGGDDSTMGSDGSVSDGATGSDASVVLPELEPYTGPAVITDCDVEAGYEVSSWRAVDPSSPRLWVGGVYETRDDHDLDHHPRGSGTVTWAIPGDNVLVLGAYEPVDWTITVGPGGALTRVIATGYYVPTVTAPEGVAVEIHAHEAGTSWACGHALPGGGGGCEGEEIVAFAMQATDLPLHAFDGCYHASAFEYLQ